ncbi:MAG: HIT family protein [Methanomicrobiales archaeon]|nr:HIT family protein [Methanomicrobiales archaeon]
MAQDAGTRCPFCTIPRERIFAQNELCFATWDVNPVSKGHTLLIPFRHVADFFQTTPEEQRALLALSGQVKEVLDRRHHPAGYNLGVNVGAAAGQAVPHVHFHLVPRYPGDARGQGSGMRHVIPGSRETQAKLTGYLPKRVTKREEGGGEE